MREIKFRAWNHDTKRMSEIFDITDDFDWYKEEYPCYDLMQYTGLHDKNGKEIYEGDILKYNSLKHEYHAEVYFDKDNSKFDLTIETMPTWSVKLEDGEVIGNIYENPELLEVKKDL